MTLVSEYGNFIWPMWAAMMRSYQIYIVISVATHSPKMEFSKCTLDTLVSYTWYGVLIVINVATNSLRLIFSKHTCMQRNAFTSDGVLKRHILDTLGEDPQFLVFTCIKSSYICFVFCPLSMFRCIFKEIWSKQVKSHWLQMLDFSPLCIFKCFLKLPAWKQAKSNWLHLFVFQVQFHQA